MIWANHSMRAAMAAMQHVCGRIIAEERVAGIEPHIATLDDDFDLLRGTSNSPDRKRDLSIPLIYGNSFLIHTATYSFSTGFCHAPSSLPSHSTFIWRRTATS
ncbi:hypothetical protein [Bradyrhizobium sp. CB3481]|uniref:hypothetical protein n=1 Tax=Bradyrhizobium sp. CB3481 TaxID=3039158 RepID=UPI0032C24A40